MKKTICILLCVLLVLSALTCAVAAADDALPFLVATDLHYAETPQTATVNFPGDTYYTAGKGTTLRTESNAIIRQFLRQAAASDAQFVLLCGDLVDDGTAAQHQALADMFRAFEESSGKQIFVINGNHDFNAGITVQEFKSFYADFGYSQALAVDAATCSYTADLDGRYRLLAFDSCDHTTGADGITDALLAWAAEQAEQAKRDGKQLITILHHNFLEHFDLQAKLLPVFIVRPAVDLKHHLLNWGVRYVFSGHLHAHDILDYTDKDGRRVYDIATTSLSGYPCSYRTCTLTAGGLDTDTCRLTGVDAADLPQSGYTPQLLDALQHDLESYAYGCFRNMFSVRKDSFFSQTALRGILSRFGGDAVQRLIDACYPAFYADISLPIYTKDAPDGRSLQAIAETLGLQLPETDRVQVSDSLFYFVVTLFCGDEHILYNDKEIMLFVQCLYCALYDAMQTVHADLRQTLLSDVRQQFRETALPLAVTGAVQAALGAVRDERMIEAVLLAAAPVVELYANDDGPADNRAFLPDADDAPQTVWTEIMRIVQYVWRYLQRVFRRVGALYLPRLFAN